MDKWYKLQMSCEWNWGRLVSRFFWPGLLGTRLSMEVTVSLWAERVMCFFLLIEDRDCAQEGCCEGLLFNWSLWTGLCKLWQQTVVSSGRKMRWEVLLVITICLLEYEWIYNLWHAYSALRESNDFVTGPKNLKWAFRLASTARDL